MVEYSGKTILCRRLTDEVSVVFHSAATINFDEKLTKAVNLNVGAVFTILEICKKMKKLEVIFSLFSRSTLIFLILQALVHISTAYSNPQLKTINEEIYTTNTDPVGMMELCKVMIINR